MNRCCATFCRQIWGEIRPSFRIFPTSSSYLSFILGTTTDRTRRREGRRMGSIQRHRHRQRRAEGRPRVDGRRGEFTLELSHRTENCLPPPPLSTDRVGTTTFKRKRAFFLPSSAIVEGRAKNSVLWPADGTSGNLGKNVDYEKRYTQFGL